VTGTITSSVEILNAGACWGFCGFPDWDFAAGDRAGWDWPVWGCGVAVCGGCKFGPWRAGRGPDGAVSRLNWRLGFLLAVIRRWRLLRGCSYAEK
jgi:hypothetical protein